MELTYDPDDVLRSVREEHQAVEATMRWLRAHVEEARARGGVPENGTRAQVLDLGGILAAWMAELRDHFRREEDEAWPELSRSAVRTPFGRLRERLRLDHVALLRELDGIFGQMRSARAQAGLPSGCLERLEAAFETLKRHESMEEELLEEWARSATPKRDS